MHLYLSSFLLGNRAGDLATLVHTQKAAIVANALDHASSSVRREYAEGQILEFSRLGFEAGELDLRDYFDSRRDLSTVLDAVGLVWVTGGNSFLLRRAMKQSRFDTYIMEHRASNRLVYLSITHIFCQFKPDSNIGETSEATPHHGIARW